MSAWDWRRGESESRRRYETAGRGKKNGSREDPRAGEILRREPSEARLLVSGPDAEFPHSNLAPLRTLLKCEFVRIASGRGKGRPDTGDRGFRDGYWGICPDIVELLYTQSDEGNWLS